MSLAAQLVDYINAGFSGLWVQTSEPDEAEREIVRLSAERKWRLAVWDVAGGLRISAPGGAPAGDGAAVDPVAVLRSLPALADEDSTAVLVLHNFHRFLTNAEVIQTTFRQLVDGKVNRAFIVVLAPVVQVPVELEKLFIVIEHPLPDRQQLEAIIRGLTTEEPTDLPTGAALGTVLDAAAGLTRYEAEGAYALSLARHGSIRADVVSELKCQALKKSSLVTMHRGQERFADLGGLGALKDFCVTAIRRSAEAHPEAKPRGVLLLGVPGTGKSAFAKALGNETDRPTLMLDIGALMGSLVGQTEQNVRRALQIIEAFGKSIVFVDEIEKGLAGVQSSGQTDSGVTARLFGSLLTWLNDRPQSDVFFIATANNVSALPPEFTRAERFDGIFFIDLPSVQEKAAIWRLYLQKFGLDAGQAKPRDIDWTGAEIKSCCRLAALLDVSLIDAAKNVVPVAVTAAESIEKLRNWASSRCLSSDRPGIYLRASANPGGGKSGRRVQQDPSVN